MFKDMCRLYINSFAQIVYITRNPKDVSVSMYFFYQAVTRYGYRGTFQEFYKLFCNGTGELIFEQTPYYSMYFRLKRSQILTNTIRKGIMHIA